MDFATFGGTPEIDSNWLRNLTHDSTAQAVHPWVAQRLGKIASRSDRKGLGTNLLTKSFEIRACSFCSSSHSGLKCVRPFRSTISAATSSVGREPLSSKG